MSDPHVISLASVPRVPHIDQYLGEWAIEPQRFESLLSMASRMNMAEHVKQAQAQINARGEGDPQPKPTDRYQIIDGVAVIEIVGAMTKYGSSFSENAGSVALRRSVRQAVSDSRAKAIMVKIDSPGGTIAGTHELADEIAAANTVKPVTAYIEDLGASAAYWVASRAGRVVANNSSALVGSIGSYAVLYDHSAAAEKAGIKAIVVKAGEHKAAGAWGTQITPEQVAETQRVVDALNAQFKASVMTGRRMNQQQVDAVADGRIHTAEQALKLGLIDAIQTMDQAIAALAKSSVPRPSGTTAKAQIEENTVTQKTENQAETAPAPKAEAPKADQPATIKELKAAFPKASNDFHVACLEQGLTLAQAKDARLADLETQAQAKEQELQNIKAQGGSKPAAPGAKPLASKPAVQAEDSAQSATEQWEAALDKKVKAGVTKQRAISLVAKENPDLHRAYIDEVNAQRKGRAAS